MNRPTHLRARLAVVMTGGALIAALFPLAGGVLAAATVSAVATGGSAISADTAGTGGTGAYTTLTGPSIASATTGDFVSGTLTLTAPSGFEFRASGVSVASSGAGCPGLDTLTPAAAAITLDLTTGSTGVCTLAFSGIGVRPKVGTSLSTGDITASGAGITGSPLAGHLVEVAGAPILTFTRQPAGATGGSPFGTQPQVTSMDKFGNLRSGDVITLAVNTSTTPGVLTCPTATTNGSGIATFSGCSIDRVGSYTLRATTPGQAGAIPVSNSISITVGIPARLVFYQKPTLAVANVAFPTQPIVAVADLGGNLVPAGSGSTNVSLAITSGSGSLLCTVGPTSVPTVSTFIGVLASFSGCRNSTAGIGDVMTATSAGGTLGSLTAATATFDVENLLVFAASPAATIGGALFAPQPVVTVQANSAIATNDSTTVVTLGIASGTGAPGATLTCTGGLSKTVVAGVATFAGCSVNKLSPVGIPYQLVATTTTGLSPAYSTSFAVTLGAATQVAFTTQPVNSAIAQLFPASPVVAIQDTGGNTITTGTDSTRTVTLSIGTNPGGGTLTCTGGLSKAAVAGVATFTGCSIDRIGTGYTLAAFSSGLSGATSVAFNVTVPGTTISLTRSHGMITYGESVTFAVQFGAGGANRPFVIQYTSVGVPWTTIANLVTNSSGFASFAYTPSRTGYVRAVYAGATDLGASTSTVYIVGVRQTVSTLSPHHTGTMTIPGGTSITFSTTVRPTRADNAPNTVTFRIYRKVGGTWVLAYQRNVLTNTSGVASYTFHWGTSAAGNWYVRAYAPRTPYNSITRYTAPEYYLVQ